MSDPIDGDYTDQQTAGAWSSDGSQGESFSDVSAEGASDLATLPDYSLGSPMQQTNQANVPDSHLQGIQPGPNLGDDQYSSSMDAASAARSLGDPGSAALPSLAHAASAQADRVSQASAEPAPTPGAPSASPFGGTASPWGSGGGEQQPPVNSWTDTSSPGTLSAHLVYADYSLLAAVAAAGIGAGGQAALVAQTVAVDQAANTVSAGGNAPVGSRDTPASALAYGSEYNTSQQFHSGPWFFPAVAAWAADNPPPTSAQGPQAAESGGGELEGGDSIEPGSQFEAQQSAARSVSSDLAGGIAKDVEAITEGAADLLI